MRLSVLSFATALGLATVTLLGSCADTPASSTADSTEARGEVEVLLTEPYCDVCTAEDKNLLAARSPIVAKVVELVDGATASVDVAQFTFSSKPIEAALLRAHERGVAVRVAMDSAQDQAGSVARRLRDAGLEVRFVKGGEGGPHTGIMHAKFMLVDGQTLLTGSNNWSSTGTSINEENTIVLRLPESDPRIVGHACQFEAIWARNLIAPSTCSNAGVAFSPSGAGQKLVRSALREATQSIDVLMHHLTDQDMVKELARAAERGVRVRVIVNAADRAEHAGRNWDRLFAAGGRIRYKQVNAEQFQLMHHKLAIVDDRILVNGSGNWSGSAFFKNFETFVRYDDPRILQPFRGLYHRLWAWSLDGASLDEGRPAHEQHAASTRAFFGNLHAHIHVKGADGRLLDDGEPRRLDESGAAVPVEIPSSVGGASRMAFEYARDRGGLDFLALSPHCVDDRPNDPAAEPNMTEAGYAEMLSTAREVSRESGGAFLGLAGMEWSTNSTGNHVTILGSERLAKTERGRFDELYDSFLTERAFARDRPIVMFAHPRTFHGRSETLNGNWDQIFGVNLLDLPKASERAQKFNDYGLDDFAPMSEVRASWIAGEVLPDEAVVFETLANISRASAPYARLMEVTLNRGNEFGSETGQNPSMTTELDGTVERRTKVHTDWDYYLLRGFRLAPVASHDNHMANWGTGHTSRTVMHAESLDEARLLTALEQREVYASEDENLALRVYAERRVFMGGSTATPKDRVSAQIHLSDPDYDGDYAIRIHRGTVGGAEVVAGEALTVSGERWIEVEFPLDTQGAHFFYVSVHELGADRMAWSAPIWVERI